MSDSMYVQGLHPYRGYEGNGGSVTGKPNKFIKKGVTMCYKLDKIK